MLFSNAAVYVVLGVAGAVVLGTVAVFRQWPESKLRWPGVGLSVLLAAPALLGLMAASHVVRVHADGSMWTGRVLGTATVHIGDSDVEVTSHGSGITAVINESDRELEIQTFVYGDLPLNAVVPPDKHVAARSAYTFYGNIDYLGPGDHPPSAVSSKSGGQVRYWLTWSR